MERIFFYNSLKGMQVSTTAISNNPGQMLCPHCGTHTMRRDHRIGALERVVYPWFHFYPWECLICRTRRLLKSRGVQVRKSSTDA